MIVLPVTALAVAIAELLLPAVLGRAIDAIAGQASDVWLTRCAWLIAALAMLDIVDDIAVGSASARSTRWVRRLVLRHVLAVGPRALRSHSPGDLATRLVTNAAGAGTIASDAVRAVANLIPAVGGAVALALIDPLLCLTFLAGFPVFVLVIRTFFRESSDAATRYLATQGELAGRLVDALTGVRTIAAAGTVDREVRRVLEPLPTLHEHGVAMWRAQAAVSVQSVLLVPLIELLVLAIAGARLAQGALTPGELVAAGQYALLATTLGSTVASVNRLVRARTSAARAADVLARAPVVFGEGTLAKGGTGEGSAGGDLDLRGVTVSGPQGPILDGIDLTFPAGALVAVVGPSGAGKTTLAEVAGRLIDPDAGDVLLDGVHLRDLSRAELRTAVTYGFERPWLLGDTLADAIAFGSVRPEPDAVVAAAVAAEADPFIRRMPGGYDTPLVHAPMSGGEVQRIGLARAFAHAGQVLILDDVAASLDTVTEHRITEVLTGALADRTRIVVAHRASTAARADLVVWLEGGRIRGLGPHRNLWPDPDYRAVFGARGDATDPITRAPGERAAAGEPTATEPAWAETVAT